MIGNVNGIVDSMFAADNIRSRQNTAGTTAKTGSSFSDYLNYALLNSRTDSLFGSGSGSGYSYLNGVSGSVWQTFALKALIDSIQKNDQTAVAADTQQESGVTASKTANKPDWAKIRVVQYYQSPKVQENSKSQGILV